MQSSIRSRIATATLSLLAVTGCVFDESKSDNRNPTPTIQPELSTASSVDRTIPTGTTGAKDSVRIAFAADSGKTYRLIVADSTSSFSLHVESLDSTGQYSSFAMDFSKKTTIIDFPCVATGTYYLVVVGKPGTSVRSSETVREGLPSNFVPPDRFEPDSTLHTASEIAPDGNWNQRTCTSGLLSDVDWYSTQVRPGYTYTIEFKDSLVLYGGARSLWGADSNRIGLPTTSSLDYSSFESGKIWFRTDCDPTGNRYRLRVTETAGYPTGSILPDKYESDDSLHPVSARADSGSLARTMHGSGSSRDIDWTEYVVSRGFTWTIHLWDTTGSVSANLSGLPEGIIANTTNLGWKSKANLTSFTFPAPVDAKVTLRTSSTKAGGYALQAFISGPLPDSIRMPDSWEFDSKTRPMLLKVDSVEVSRSFHGIRTSRDTDWVAIGLDSGRTYFVRIRDTSGTTDGEWAGIPDEISIEDAGTSTLGKKGYTTIASFPSIAKGQLLIQMRDSLAVGYTITAWSHPGLPDSLLPERGEPDNIPGLAYDASVDSPSVGKRVARHDTDWISVHNHADSGAVLRIKNLGGGILAWRTAPGAPIRQVSPGWTDSVRMLSPRTQRILAEIWNTDTSGTRIQYSVQAATVALPPDALEPDDLAATPAALVQGAPFVQRWTSPDDTDWMAMDLPAGRAAKVSWIADQGAALDAFTSGLRPASVIAPQKHGDTLVEYMTISGKLFLRASSSLPGIAKYRIRIDTVTLDPDEPYTSRSKPMAATFDTAGTKLWVPAGDTDWIQVQTRAGGYYLYTDLSNIGVSLEFEGSEVKPESHLSGWSGWTATKAGSLLFRLVGNPTTNSALPIATTFRVRETMTDTLLGDSLDPAPLAADGRMVTRVIGQETTRWMVAPVKKGWSYFFNSGTGSGSAFIDLYCDAKNVGRGWSGTTRATWTANATGNVLVKLEAMGNSLLSPPDTVRFSLLEWQEEADEPNNDSLHSSSLPTDSTVQTRINPQGDVDYFKIEMQPGKWYTVTIDAPANSRLNLLDPIDHVKSFWTSGKGPETFDLGGSETATTRHFLFTPLGTDAMTTYRIAVSSHDMQNTIASSILLKGDSTLVTGSIPPGTTNLFRLPVLPGRSYRIEIDAPAFTVVNTLKPSDSASRTLFHQASIDYVNLGEAMDTGTWYVRIVPGSATGTTNYKLSAVEAYLETSEPDSPEHPSSFHGSHSKYIEGNTEDWFEIPAQQIADSISMTSNSTDIDWELVGPLGSKIGALPYHEGQNPQTRIYALQPSATGYLAHIKRKVPGTTALSYDLDFGYLGL